MLDAGLNAQMRRGCRETGTPWPRNLCKVAASTTSRSWAFLFKDTIRLLADAQLADDFAVAVRIVRLEVVQQAATFADEHQ
jgi:hypothetical protein